MSYAIDLSRWSLNKYKNVIENCYLIPSQRILLESLDQYFAILQENGIDTAKTLKKELSTKKKAVSLADSTGIPEEYLIVLRREIHSRIPKPRPLEEYPTISDNLKSAMKNAGIKNSAQMYDFFEQSGSIDSAAVKLNSKRNEVMHAFSLINVTRLRYVSPLFATVLILGGYDSIKAIQDANPKEMCRKMKEINSKNKWYKGNIGENDMKFLITDSQLFEDELI